MSTTTRGTSHFQSRYAAIKYYADYGYDANDVIEKIQRGEIHIGEPQHGPTDIASADHKGRYHITSQDEPVINGYTKAAFVAFLEGILIPDLKASGSNSMADDFETAVKFINA